MKRQISILLSLILFLSYTIVYRADSSESEGSRVIVVTSKDNNGSFSNNDNVLSNKYEINLLETTSHENTICIEYNKNSLDTVNDIADKIVITIPHSIVEENKIKSNYPEVINKISKSASLNELYATDITIELLPYAMLNANKYKFEIPFILNSITNLSNVTVLLQKGDNSNSFSWNIATTPYNDNTNKPDIEPLPEPTTGVFNRFNNGTHFAYDSKAVFPGINYKVKLEIMSTENEENIALSLRHPSLYFKDTSDTYILGNLDTTIKSLSKNVVQTLSIDIKADIDFNYDEPLKIFVNDVELTSSIKLTKDSSPIITDISSSLNVIPNQENVASFRLTNSKPFETDQSFIIEFNADSDKFIFSEEPKVFTVDKGLSSSIFTIPFTTIKEFTNENLSCTIKSYINNKKVTIAEKSLKINSLADDSPKIVDYRFKEISKVLNINDNNKAEISLNIINDSDIAQAITVKIQPSDSILSFESNSSTSIEKLNSSLYSFTRYINANSSADITLLAVINKVKDVISEKNINAKFTITNSDDDESNNICDIKFIINKEEESSETPTEESSENSFIDYLFKHLTKSIGVKSLNTSEIPLDIVNNSNTAQTITVKIQFTDPILSFKSSSNIDLKKINSFLYTFDKYVEANSLAELAIPIEIKKLNNNILQKDSTVKFTITNSDSDESNNTCIVNLKITGDEEFTEESTEFPTEEPTEPSTEKPTELPTEEPTEPSTEKPTELPTEEPTEPSTEKPTEPPTEQPTEPSTEKPTEPPTEQPTEPSTEKPTEPPTEQPTESPIEDKINLNDYFSIDITSTSFEINKKAVIGIKTDVLKPIKSTIYNPKAIIEVTGIVAESNTGHYLETVYIPSLSIENIEKVKVALTPKVIGKYTVSIRLEADNLISSGGVYATEVFEINNDNTDSNLIDIDLNDYFDIDIVANNLALNKKNHIQLNSFLIKPVIYQIENPRVIFTVIGNCDEATNNRYSIIKNLSSLDTKYINDIDFSFTPKSYGDYIISCSLLVDNILPNGSLYQTKTISISSDNELENTLNLNKYFELDIVSSPITINTQTIVRLDAKQLQSIPYDALNPKLVFEVIGVTAESDTNTYTKTISLSALTAESISNSIITFTPITYGDYIISAYLTIDNTKPLGSINITKTLSVLKPVESINLSEYFDLNIDAKLELNKNSAINVSVDELKPFSKSAVNPKIVCEINGTSQEGKKDYYTETIELPSLTVDDINKVSIKYFPKFQGLYTISILLTTDNLLPFGDLNIIKNFEINEINDDNTNKNIDLNDYFKFEIISSSLAINKQSVLKLNVTTLKNLYHKVINPRLVFEITGDTLGAINNYYSKTIPINNLSELEKTTMIFTPNSIGNYIVSVSLLIDNVLPLGSIHETITLTVDKSDLPEKIDLNDYFNLNILNSTANLNKQVTVGLEAQNLISLNTNVNNPTLVFKILGDVLESENETYIENVNLKSLTVENIEKSSISFTPKSSGTYVISVSLVADNVTQDGIIEKVRIIDIPKSSEEEPYPKPPNINLNDYFDVNIIHSLPTINKPLIISLDTKQIKDLQSEVLNPRIVFTVIGNCKESNDNKYTFTHSLSNLTIDSLNNTNISVIPQSYDSYSISISIIIDNALPSDNIYLSKIITITDENIDSKPEPPLNNINLNDYFNVEINSVSPSVNQKVTIKLDTTQIQPAYISFINPKIIYEVTGDILESNMNSYKITKSLTSLNKQTIEQETFSFTPKQNGTYLVTATIICDNLSADGRIYEIKTINLNNSEEDKPDYREIDLNDYFSFSLYTSPLDINVVSVVGINANQLKVLNTDVKNPRLVFEIQGDIAESKDKYYSITKHLSSLNKLSLENTNITFTPEAIGSYTISVSLVTDNLVTGGEIVVKTLFKLGNVPDDENNKPTPNPTPNNINLNEYFTFNFTPESIKLNTKSVVSLSATQIKELDTTIINPRIIFEVTGIIKESENSIYQVERKLTAFTKSNIESVNIAFTPDFKGIYTITATLLADNISSNGSIYKRISYDLSNENNEEGFAPDKPIIAYALVKVSSELVHLDKGLATLKITVSNKSDYLLRDSELQLSFNSNVKIREPNRSFSFRYSLGNLNKNSIKVLEFPIEILKSGNPEIMVKFLSKDINNDLYTPSDYYNTYLSLESLPNNDTNLPTYNISGIVFNDTNNNNQYETNEVGLAGVSINLKDIKGSIISSTISDSVGYYSFDNIKSGQYTILAQTIDKQIKYQVILSTSSINDCYIGFHYKDKNDELDNDNNNNQSNISNEISKDVSVSLSIIKQTNSSVLANITIKNNSSNPAHGVYLIIRSKDVNVIVPDNLIYSNTYYKTNSFSLLDEENISLVLNNISKNSSLYVETIYDNDLYPYNNSTQQNLYSYVNSENSISSNVIDKNKTNRNNQKNSIINNKEIVDFVNTLYKTSTYNASESKSIVSSNTNINKVVSTIQDTSKILYSKEYENKLDTEINQNLEVNQIPKLPQTGINEIALSFPSQGLLFILLFFIGSIIYLIGIVLEKKGLISNQ